MADSHQEIAGSHKTEHGGTARPREKRVIHFASGETLEVGASEEEEEEEEELLAKRAPFGDPPEQARLSFRRVLLLIGRMSLLACDCVGGRLAGALGLNAAKYQYAIDRHRREQKGTSSEAEAVGPSQGVHLSGQAVGSRYGAAADAGPPPPKTLEVQQGGRHNRGYREDENHSK